MHTPRLHVRQRVLLEGDSNHLYPLNTSILPCGSPGLMGLGLGFRASTVSSVAFQPLHHAGLRRSHAPFTTTQQPRSKALRARIIAALHYARKLLISNFPSFSTDDQEVNQQLDKGFGHVLKVSPCKWPP